MLSFLAMGDFGANTKVRQEIAHLIKKTYKTAVLGLGDNFYNYGIESADHPKWKDEFMDVYQPNCPWYMVLGNHDYLGNIEAQIEFTKKQPFWKMPARYYEQKIYYDKKDYVHLFCLDTFELSPLEAKHNSLGMGMPLEEWNRIESRLRPDIQINWFKHHLKNSDAKWKIVTGHYPLFSAGNHGDNPQLIQMLLPIFQEHKVDFYLCGHDHNLQHTSQLETQFIVSGGGCCVIQKRPDKKFFNIPNEPGICFLHLEKNRGEFGFLNPSGKILYKKSVFPNSEGSFKLTTRF